MRRAALIAALSALGVTVTLGGGAALGAVSPVVRVLGNQEVLLESVDGDMLACAPSLDERRVPRMACGLVDFSGGVDRGPIPGTLIVQVTDAGLRVVRYAEQPRDLFHAPLRDAILAQQVRRATFGTLDFQAGRRYYFSGTRIVCRLQPSGVAVRCDVVDRRLTPLRRSHAFVIGFRSVQVLRVDPAGRTRIVFTARHSG